ncbi:hypothetical protein TNCV_2885961 [Trichonephila clavipes]|nr:hypothetical protein TNCV_2885961 [Trichonephila clavipes]
MGCGNQPSGKDIGSWQAFHEFEPSTTKHPPCRGAMHVKSVEKSNDLPLVWSLFGSYRDDREDFPHVRAQICRRKKLDG